MIDEPDKLRKYFSSELKKAKEEFLADNAEIKLEVQKSKEATDSLEKTMNGRVKDIELWKAREEGRASVSNSAPINWNKIILGIIGLASAALAVALVLAQGLKGNGI